MTTVTIRDTYATALEALGDMNDAVDIALQRYTIEQITAKIRQLSQRDMYYQNKYGLDYAAFHDRAVHDEDFIRVVETTVTPTWEIDSADWEFCVKGISDWTQTLQSILLP